MSAPGMNGAVGAKHYMNSGPWQEPVTRDWHSEPLIDRLERCREFLVAHEVMMPYESREVRVRILKRADALLVDRREGGEE